MIENKSLFYKGFAMIVGFLVVLVVMFMPVLGGQNALEYSDSLYNSISKGSAYYIPKMKAASDAFTGHSVKLALTLDSQAQAGQTALLFQKGGALINVSGPELKVSGDLGRILGNCLMDADQMYFNNGQAVAEKYGYDERRVLYNWHRGLLAAEKDLKGQKKFEEAKIIAAVLKKAVECSYNYYEIAPQKISDRWGIVIFSLVFYVIYTLWYGFGIMFMFEGWGMKLEH